jgi:phenylacetate-CoA ligase
MRLFEDRTTSPNTVRRAGRVLHGLVRNTLSPGVMGEIQARRLRQLVYHLYQNSPFYHRLFQQSDIDPEDIGTPADLQQVPFTSSDDLHDWQRFLCKPVEETAAAFATAGTTGQPKRVYFSFDELRALTNLSAVALRIGHPGPLVALLALPMRHGLWMGWNIAMRAVQRAGGLPLPVGAGDPHETLKWMQWFKPNVVFSSPSYMAALTRHAEEEGYHHPLEKILTGGEVLTQEHRARFEAYWGAQVFDTYGSTEIGGGQTIRLPQCEGLHLNDLHLVTEIIDPETGHPAQEGELVFTTLRRETMPFLRYRSGDGARWCECPCWLPFKSIQLTGRLDDMIVAGDMNLYGSVIGRAIADLPGASGLVRIQLDKVDLADRMTLCVAGKSVEENAVRRALYQAYPSLPEAINVGNLLLEIEPNADLGTQIKAVAIHDDR